MTTSFKNSIFRKLILLSSLALFSGALSCGNGTSNTTQSTDQAGANVSACLEGEAIDYAAVFAGPCELDPVNAEDNENATPNQTISYANLLAVVLKDSPDGAAELTSVLNCVAQASYCIGETQCLTVGSICQFAVNCGADSNPCENGSGACNANQVASCGDVQNKSTCNAAYEHSCFDSSGASVNCDNPPSPIANQDNHNCYWGVDSETNRTGCFRYGSGYADGACTLP